jgi:nitrite reductase/ring-hydroxylating ferredoxin subunit
MDYEWKNIGPLENIPVQRARRLCFGYQGRPIAIFRTAEEGVFALIDECPHTPSRKASSAVTLSRALCTTG